MNRRKSLLNGIMPNELYRTIEKISDENIEKLEELRLRTCRGTYLKGLNAICRYIPSVEDIKNIIYSISDYSIYAHLDEITRGFITMADGHRVGISGKVIFDNGKISNIVDISSICIRFAREIKGVASPIEDELSDGNILIISPPGCGKTTLLRDISRIIGKCNNVALIDERGELASCVNGVPQLDVGANTDVITLCSKAVAIPMTIRSMCPDVIITDEISYDDTLVINKASTMGVRVIASIHGSCIDDVRSRIDARSFNKFIVLDKDKNISEVVSNDL
ncbi:MAG: ATPase, T2SS/T4P/T4SS family [Eubacteriales bacterium]|nr:ATPase, T2SS/T4P/T4SS family [Eubacteriales bacterium]